MNVLMWIVAFASVFLLGMGIGARIGFRVGVIEMMDRIERE